MRNIFLFALISLFISCGQNDKSDKKENNDKTAVETKTEKSPGAKPANAMFDIKAAKITFNYSDGNETGTETLYFEDYGNRAVLVVDKKSKYGKTSQTQIWKDKKTTIIDHEKKTVATSGFRPKATEPPAIADTDDNTKKNIGYEKLTNESVAGKNCEVWFNAKQNFKYCLWNKIALKEVLGTSINREATAVDEISEIPASVMEVPKDYKQ
ncbi:MAG: hypothetical protein HOP10_09870 [Chitinophagaceae bacterium]|nr:hypothetical protein [Chitinophagaceae bacterium]